MPNAPAVTNAAEAAVLSLLENVSAIKRRLMARALPKPLKNRPIMTRVRELCFSANAYKNIPNQTGRCRKD